MPRYHHVPVPVTLGCRGGTVAPELPEFHGQTEVVAVRKVWVLAVGTAAFAMAVTGCGGTGAVAPQNLPSSISATSPAASTATTGTPPSSSRQQGGAENLRVNPHVLAQLVSAFAAGQHLRSSDVARTKPGSVYYAFMPSTVTYWAVADFVPSAQAITQSHEAADGGPLVQFQDGPWIFSRPQGGAWKLTTDTGGTGPCPGQVPGPVLAAWGMRIPAVCSAGGA